MSGVLVQEEEIEGYEREGAELGDIDHALACEVTEAQESRCTMICLSGLEHIVSPLAPEGWGEPLERSPAPCLREVRASASARDVALSSRLLDPAAPQPSPTLESFPPPAHPHAQAWRPLSPSCQQAPSPVTRTSRNSPPASNATPLDSLSRPSPRGLVGQRQPPRPLSSVVEAAVDQVRRRSRSSSRRRSCFTSSSGFRPSASPSVSSTAGSRLMREQE